MKIRSNLWSILGKPPDQLLSQYCNTVYIVVRLSAAFSCQLSILQCWRPGRTVAGAGEFCLTLRRRKSWSSTCDSWQGTFRLTRETVQLPPCSAWLGPGCPGGSANFQNKFILLAEVIENRWLGIRSRYTSALCQGDCISWFVSPSGGGGGWNVLGKFILSVCLQTLFQHFVKSLTSSKLECFGSKFICVPIIWLTRCPR